MGERTLDESLVRMMLDMAVDGGICPTPGPVMAELATAWLEVAQHERIVAGLEADARRYVALRAMCCGDGPTDAIAQAWMTGNEQAADAAIDAFLAQTADGVK